MDLTIERCEDATAWNQFVESSPHGSVFCKTPFFKALNEPFNLYFILENGRPVLALPVNESTPVFVPYAHYTTFRFAIYQGPMFSPEVEEMPVHSAVPRRMRLMDFALAELTARHRRVSFTLSPHLTDLRSFQWFNYHHPEGGRFDVHLRYTGLVDLRSPGREQLRRRREMARAARQEVVCETSDDFDVLDWLDDLGYERQSLTRDPADRVARRAIAESALRHGYGRCLLARSARGEVASAYLCLFDRQCAYYLFAGNHPDSRRSGASSLLMLHALDMFRNEGKWWFDFVGLNSPRRGDFKSSFNAMPTPHYLVDWKTPPR
jgi:hypothetical protein